MSHPQHLQTKMTQLSHTWIKHPVPFPRKQRSLLKTLEHVLQSVRSLQSDTHTQWDRIGEIVLTQNTFVARWFPLRSTGYQTRPAQPLALQRTWHSAAATPCANSVLHSAVILCQFWSLLDLLVSLRNSFFLHCSKSKWLWVHGRFGFRRIMGSSLAKPQGTAACTICTYFNSLLSKIAQSK